MDEGGETGSRGGKTSCRGEVVLGNDLELQSGELGEGSILVFEGGTASAQFAEAGLGSGARDVGEFAIEGQAVFGEGGGGGGGGEGAEVGLGEGDGDGGVGREVELGVSLAPVPVAVSIVPLEDVNGRVVNWWLSRQRQLGGKVSNQNQKRFIFCG